MMMVMAVALAMVTTNLTRTMMVIMIGDGGDNADDGNEATGDHAETPYPNPYCRDGGDGDDVDDDSDDDADDHDDYYGDAGEHDDDGGSDGEDDAFFSPRAGGSFAATAKNLGCLSAPPRAVSRAVLARATCLPSQAYCNL